MTDTEAVKRELHSQMLRLFDNVGSASAAAGGPYWPRRYLQMVRTHGGQRSAGSRVATDLRGSIGSRNSAC